MELGSVFIHSDCPVGEVFYACQTINFRGCCPDDPCTRGVCPKPRSEDEETDNDGDERSTSPDRDRDETTSMTDSGITRTLPNTSTVTVTRHTTIVTGRPSSITATSADAISTSVLTSVTATTLMSSATSMQLPKETQPGEFISSESGSGSSLPQATIIGIASGGGVALILLIVAMFFIWHHSKVSRQQQRHARAMDEDDLVEEKHFPSVSAQTTGTGAHGDVDPFAPFGGRVDNIEPYDPYRPRSGVFEMDGTSAAPVELPAVPAGTASPPRVTRYQGTDGPFPTPAEGRPANMSSNLNGLVSHNGQPAVVGHWNQYGRYDGHPKASN